MRLKSIPKVTMKKRTHRQEKSDTPQKRPQTDTSEDASIGRDIPLSGMVEQKGVPGGDVQKEKGDTVGDVLKEMGDAAADMQEQRVEAVEDRISKIQKGKKRVAAKDKTQSKIGKRKRVAINESEEENTDSAKEDNTRKRNSLSTRMSPNGLFKMINKLSPQQRQAVEEIGFGGLLKLTLSECHGQLSKYLVENFDFCRCTLVLKKEELELSEEDVISTMDLPCGKNVVVEAKGDKDNDEYNALLKSWRERWGITTGSPITIYMGDEIVKREDFGDDFKRDFTVFVVSSILKGHQSRKSNYKVLFSLINVNEIKELNWCHYTIKSLVQSVQEWKKKPNGFFTGPIPFLLLSYLDRVVFKVRDDSRNFPALSCWTALRVKQRVNDELKAGGFGKGKVVDRLKNIKSDEQHKEKAIQRVESNKSTDVRKESVEKVFSVLKKMAATVVEFREAMSEIGRVHSGSEKLKNILSSVSEMFNNVTSAQGEELAAVNFGDKTTGGDEDDFFNDSSFLEAVPELEKAISKTQKNPTANGTDAHSFSLGQNDGNDEIGAQEKTIEETMIGQEKTVEERAAGQEKTVEESVVVRDEPQTTTIEVRGGDEP